jgi:hypothetical protein
MATATKPRFTKTAIREAARAARRHLEPLDHWARNCHGASLEVVKAEVIEGARVARGVCSGVGSQHSWIVIGDPYDRKAPIIDPTLWSYDASVKGVWTGTLADGRHTPHGSGNIFEWGKPAPPAGPGVELEPAQPFSDDARLFLDLLGPLDVDGWRMLCHAPVECWPAGEILDAIIETFDWGAAVIPIDIVGMVTDRNPSGLYLPGKGS